MNASGVANAAVRRADVAIIGDGIIGVTAALELGRQGASVVLIGTPRPGKASVAAAGLLVPSVGKMPRDGQPFFEDSLARFPAFVAGLDTPDGGPLFTEGLLELREPGAVERSLPNSASLSASEVAALEPALVAPYGAWIHRKDGAVDLMRLLAAVRMTAEKLPTVQFIAGSVTHVALAAAISTLHTDAGSFEAKFIVLAAGAWSPRIGGLPRSIPIVPLKGQIVALDRMPIRRPVMASEFYVAPRGDTTIVGSTSERVGFDVATTVEARDLLVAFAVEVCPALREASVRTQWAGLRPATPDMLPIVGPDPDLPRLLYACGHGRNGILLSPATAAAIVGFCGGPAFDLPLDRFSITRFDA